MREYICKFALENKCLDHNCNHYKPHKHGSTCDKGQCGNHKEGHRMTVPCIKCLEFIEENDFMV